MSNCCIRRNRITQDFYAQGISLPVIVVITALQDLQNALWVCPKT